MINTEPLKDNKEALDLLEDILGLIDDIGRKYPMDRESNRIDDLSIMLARVDGYIYNRAK
jgi:hypothetical protein